MEPRSPLEPGGEVLRIVRTTPIEPRTAEQERELAQRLAAERPAVVLSASDLHMAAGRDPRTGNFPITENFYEDEAFARWLRTTADGLDGPALLVLNGDTFDFLRITSVPRTDAEITRWQAWLRRLEVDHPREQLAVNRTERRFGLKTHDYRTVWKLRLIAEGHPGFFGALAEWLGGGHTLLVVKGNHDVELHWPLVRQALRDLLVQHGAPVAAAQERVGFVEDGLAVGNVWIEHGHRFEAMTAVDGPPVLPGTEEIRLPIGSFINRYFINRIETLDPFLDNIRPVNHALVALLRRYPLSIVGTYFRAWKLVWKAIRPLRLNTPVILIFLGLMVPVLSLAVVAAAFMFPDFRHALQRLIPGRAWVERTVAALGIAFPLLLPYLAGAARQLWREVRRLFFPSRRDDEYVEGAREALRHAFPNGGGFERVYAVMGHTHDPRAVAVENAGTEAVYLNDGTWIAIWPQDRPDLVGRVVRSFVRFDRGDSGEYAHASLVWDDAAGAARDAAIMIPADDWNRRRVLREAELPAAGEVQIALPVVAR
ncbi:MAG TPA: hypothetical protein VFX98_14420 [Longimicrobiaceae bacterium]|nr:hypothetical protein [Longimicrobiaceae bacterium]